MSSASDDLPSELLMHSPVRGTGSWTPTRDGNGRGRRRVMRILFGVLGIGTIGTLLYMLAEPFSNPDIHLVAVALGPTESNAVTSHVDTLATRTDFRRRDLAALEKLGEKLHQYDENHPPTVFQGTNSSADVPALGNRLVATMGGKSNVLLLYIAAEGMADGQTARLKWHRRGNASQFQQGTVQQFLEQVPREPATAKLLILDIIPPTADPPGSGIADQFPRLLRSAVQATGDRSLWVMVSHSEFERSHVDPHLRRGVYSYFVTRGLSGAADLNSDRTITLRELHAYVSNTVSAWVSQQSAFRHSQTPMLIWGGGEKLPRVLPDLIPSLTLPRDIAEVIPQSDDDDSGEATLPTASLFPAKLTVPEAVKAVDGDAGQLSSLRPFPQVPDILNAGAEADAVDAAEEGVKAADGKAKPADDKKVAAAKDAPAEESKAAGNDGAAKEQKPESAATASLAEKFTSTWNLRDRLIDRRYRAVTPIDVAPHLWRELESRLIAYETAYRSFGPFAAAKSDEGKKSEPGIAQEQSEQISTGIDEIRRLMQLLADQKTTMSPTAGQLEKRIVGFLAARKRIMTEPRSLGFAEWLDRRFDRRLTVEERRSLDDFDRLIARGSRSLLEERIAKLTPQERRRAEWQLAARFAARPPIDWPSIRMALAVRRYAEQVAAVSMGRLRWVRALIETADRYRLSGERRLLDQIGSDSTSAARIQLVSALEGYRRAADRIEIIQSLEHAQRRALYRLPGDVSFWQSAAVNDAERHRAHQRLAEIIETLRQVAALLDDPTGDAARFEVVQRLHRRLSSLNADFEKMTNPLGTDAAGTAEQESAVATRDLPRRLAMLATTRLSAEERLRLLQTIPKAAFDSARSVRLPQSILAAVEPRRIGPDDWRRVLRWTAIEVGLAELSLIGAPASPAKNSKKSAASGLSRVREALRKLESAVKAAEAVLTTEDESRFWRLHRELSAELSQFLQARPGRINELVTERRVSISAADRIATTRAERALRLLSPRDIVALQKANPVEQVRQGNLLAFLLWQRARALFARNDADDETVVALNDAAEAFRRQAQLIQPELPKLPSGVTRLQVDGPKLIDLTSSEFRDVEVQVQSGGTGEMPVWYVIEYDPNFIGIEFSNGESAYNISELRRDAKSGPYPHRPHGPARIVLKPGRPSIFGFRVQRLKTVLSRPTLLVVRAVSATEYVRKTIEVRLPSPEVVAVVAKPVPNTSGTVSQRGHGVVLHPFPNREIEYGLMLRNEGRLDRVVDIELLTTSVPMTSVFPSQELNAKRAESLLSQLRPFQIVGEQKKVEVVGGNVSATLQLAAPAAKAPAAKAEAGAAGSPGRSVRNGFVLVVRDPKTNGTFFRRIAFAPQRPRRFLQPKVAYDIKRRVIDIRVAPYDTAALPPEPVKVTAELRPTGIATEPILAEAEVSRDEPNQSLSLSIPPRNDRIVEVWIHVDGFPRGFIYRVATDHSSADIPEQLGRSGVRIVEPAAGLAVAAKTRQIAATVQVDAPVGSFQDPADFVEVGTDVNRDRKLEGDATQRFHNDRQVDLRLLEVTGDGTLKIGLKVSDFQIQVPTMALNRRVNLIGRLVADGRSEWSRPVELILDAQPPRLSRVSNAVATVAVPFQMSVSVTDQGLSGVKSVEFLLDADRIGIFPEKAEPAFAEPGALGNWSATIDPGKNPAGTYTVLVRATDRAGNVSEVAKGRVRLLTKEESAGSAGGRANRVSGVVSFDGEPIAGATVSLSPKGAKPGAKPSPAAKTPKIENVTTDDQGRFTFLKVPPGEYVLMAKKRAVANKNRKAGGQTIVAIAAPSPPQQTLPQWLGINDMFGAIGGLTRAKHRFLSPLFPQLARQMLLNEPPPLLKSITDPDNLKEDAPPVVQAAAEAQMDEEKAEQKIAAIEALAKIGCVRGHPAVEEGLLASLSDPTERVRFAAVTALAELAGSPQRPLVLTSRANSNVPDFHVAWAMRGTLPEKTLSEPVVSQAEIDKYWDTHDRFREFDPMVYDPLTWAEFQRTLLLMEQAAAAGPGYDVMTRKTQARLNDLISRLSKQQSQASRPESIYHDLATFSQFAGPRVQPLKLYSTPLSKYLGSLTDEELKSATTLSSDFRRTPTGETLRSHLNHKSAKTAFPDLDEVHFLRLLKRFGVAELWPEADLQRLLDLRALGASAAVPVDERVHPWIQQIVNDGDRSRREAENAIFAGPKHLKKEWDQHRTAAETAYTRANVVRQSTSDAYRLRDRVAAELPWLANWILHRFDVASSDSSQPDSPNDILFRLIRSNRELSRNLRKPGESPADVYQRVADDFEKLNALYDAECERLLNAETTDAKTLRRIDAVLEVALVPSGQRQAFRKQRVDSRRRLKRLANKIAEQRMQCYQPTAARETAATNEKANDEVSKAAAELLIRLDLLDRLGQSAIHPVLSLIDPEEEAKDSGKKTPETERDAAGSVQRLAASQNRLRKRLSLIAQNAGRTRNLSVVDPQSYRVALLNAEEAIRVVAAFPLPMLDVDPNARRRRFDLQQLLVWHATRAVEDFWGAAGNEELPFFQRSALGYWETAVDFDNAFAGIFDQQKSSRAWIDRRVEAARTGLKTEVAPARQLHAGENVNVGVNVLFDLPAGKAEHRLPTMPAGTASVFISDGNRRIGSQSQPVKVPHTAKANESLAKLQFQVGQQPMVTSVRSLQAVTLFRGHTYSTPLNVGMAGGVSVRVKPRKQTRSTLSLSGTNESPASVVFILDCSQSMRQKTNQPGAPTRLEVAVKALGDLMDQLVKRGNTQVGVLFYGHRAAWNSDATKIVRQTGYDANIDKEMLPLEDVETVATLGRFDATAANFIKNRMKRLRPWGETPLFLSIREAIKQLSIADADTNRRIVLITDGEDYQLVPRDLQLTAEQTAKLTVLEDITGTLRKNPVPIHILGFEMSAPETQRVQAAFEQIKQISGGSYAPAVNARVLFPTLESLLGPSRYSVLNDTGATVAAANLGSQVTLNVSETKTGRMTATVGTARTSFPIEGGEAFQLVISKNGNTIESVRYLRGQPRFVPLVVGELGAASGVLAGVHLPERDGKNTRNVTFPISFQREDREVTQRFDDVWIEITPLAKDGQPVGEPCESRDSNLVPRAPDEADENTGDCRNDGCDRSRW
eukprot:g26698.t1